MKVGDDEKDGVVEYILSLSEISDDISDKRIKLEKNDGIKDRIISNLKKSNAELLELLKGYQLKDLEQA